MERQSHGGPMGLFLGRQKSQILDSPRESRGGVVFGV